MKRILPLLLIVAFGANGMDHAQGQEMQPVIKHENEKIIEYIVQTSPPGAPLEELESEAAAYVKEIGQYTALFEYKVGCSMIFGEEALNTFMRLQNLYKQQQEEQSCNK